VSYSWSFGDGASASGSTATHTFTTPGTYNVILTIVDDQGNAGTVTKSVTVS
jgi:PKD repeat protein